MDRDGNNQVNLTRHSGRDTEPQFSPNGSAVMFITNRDGNDEIYYAELEWDGGYTRYRIINQVNLTNHPSWDGNPQFSPAGDKIMFESTRDGNYELYIMDTDGNNLVNLTNSPEKDYRGNFAPDGSSITFTSFRDENFEIYMVDIDGTKLVNVSNRPDNTDHSSSFQPWPAD